MFRSNALDRKIYVPRNSVDAYKSATNWSTYADRIYPLSVYEGGGLVSFADPAVEAVCLANFDTDGNGFITKAEAEAVTTIGTKFSQNTEITSFEEFRYFTGVKALGYTYSSTREGFADCTDLYVVTLPESLTTIGVNCFGGSGVEVVNLDNVTGIYNSAFSSSQIEEVYAPKLTTVGTNVFLNCTNLRRVTSLGNLTDIPAGGASWGFFGGCTSLTFAELPETITNIGNNAFRACTSLQTVIVRATTPPTLGTGNAFSNANIYVPDNSVQAYKEASGWSAHASRIKPLSEYTE